jgi:hypothetical protein
MIYHSLLSAIYRHSHKMIYHCSTQRDIFSFTKDDISLLGQRDLLSFMRGDPSFFVQRDTSSLTQYMIYICLHNWLHHRLGNEMDLSRKMIFHYLYNAIFRRWCRTRYHYLHSAIYHHLHSGIYHHLRNQIY